MRDEAVLSPRMRAHVSALLTLAERYGVNGSGLSTLKSHAEAMLCDAKSEAKEDVLAELAEAESWEREWWNERRRNQRAAKRAAKKML